MQKQHLIRLIKVAVIVAVIWEAYRIYNGWANGNALSGGTTPASGGNSTDMLTNQTTTGQKNVQAFLMAIRQCEGTPGSDGYSMLFGGNHFSNFSNHPYLTGEWKGYPLSDTMCANAGQRAGCVSTAAGAYQINVGTWKNLRLQNSNLSDFQPARQDLAAIALIRQKGALADVQAGNLQAAVSKCASVWASLPGNTAGQPQKSIADVQDYFTSAGGTLA